ncbi:MAG TPA: serine hydrolase domain-containing protein, partial [Polyangiaceae bacterium]
MTVRRALVCSVLLGLSCGGSGVGRRADALDATAVEAPRPAPIDLSFLADDVRAGKLAGASVAISHHGRVVERSFGLASIETRKELAPSDVFRLASMTKTFTAVAIMQLVEQGKLRLSDRLTAFFPDYPPPGDQVTVEQLLRHTSGIVNVTELPTFAALEERDLTPTETLALFEREPFGFAPGSRWSYSNAGYLLLGMIVAKVSGLEYGQYLAQHIVTPAGMTRTAMCAEVPAEWHQANGHLAGPSGLAPARHVGPRTPYSAGGLCSTGSDVLRFWSALSAGRLVRPDTYAAMKRSPPLPDGTPTGYGLGLGLGSLEGTPHVGHNGGIAGFSTAMLRFDADDLTVVVLTNTEEVSVTSLVKRVARAALARPPGTPYVAPAEAVQAVVGAYAIGPVSLLVEPTEGALTLRVGKSSPKPLRWEGPRTVCVAAACDDFQLTFVPADGTAHALLLEKDGVSLGALRRAA